jgi:integrase
MVFKAYNEFRTLRVSQGLLDGLAARISAMELDRHDLLFPSTQAKGPIPLSRNTFRTKYWRPAPQRAGIDFHVRVHDLRHAHASWLLAGGADLKTVMDRLGHAQIQTTQNYLHTARRRRQGPGRVLQGAAPDAVLTRPLALAVDRGDDVDRVVRSRARSHPRIESQAKALSEGAR